MRFIGTEEGNLVNLAAVKFASAPHKVTEEIGGRKYSFSVRTLYDVSGQRLGTIFSDALSDAVETPLVVPAGPGYLLLQYFSEDVDPVLAEPVIAWRVGRHNAVAVTIDSQPSPDETQWIQRPDGIVSNGDDGWLPTRDAWLAEMQRRQAKEREPKASVHAEAATATAEA